MKKYITPIVLVTTLIALAIIIGGIVVNHQRSQVRYVDAYCAYCGSDELLDFGQTDNGEQRAHCFRCQADYTIINK